MTVLDNVKVLLGIDDETKDELLNILLNECEVFALSYTQRDRTFGMEWIIEQMVVFRYNRLGTEGLNSESYSGASYNYKDGYPDDIMKALDRFSTGVNAGGKLITY